MQHSEIVAVVNDLPPQFRVFVEPVDEPVLKTTAERIALQTISAELYRQIQPISDALSVTLDSSEVVGRFPQLRECFDDDGLLHLDDRFNLMDGGIRFEDHVLHYHQFLRRGFASNPNFDFLGTFASVRRRASNGTTFRIAIDHRRLMRFEDYRSHIECDRWFGPEFSEDFLDDMSKTGLAVVVRSRPSIFDLSNSIARTEFLWKANEVEFVKTLEIEEVRDDDRPTENWQINRYLHAERDTKSRSFRHFDGAAKVYASSTYAARLGTQMPNQPRPERYVKLFRVDGAIDLSHWLNLTSMFFRGNEMIIEYFDPELFSREFQPLIDRRRECVERRID